MFFYKTTSATVTGSTISGNDADRGGGIFFYSTSGATTVVDSTISGNTATFNGGGMFLYHTAGSVTISRSTISGNTATENGGGLFFYEAVGTTTISNSTISGNTATNGGGGGIVLYDQTLTINNSTLSGNQAPNGFGGGVYVSDSSNNVLTLNSTIVANSTDTSGTTDISVVVGTVNATNSLVENATGVTFTVNTANIFGQDPLLGGLGNNGGLTRTHALLNGSPAINTGSNPTALAFDQRGLGFVRTSGGATDIGAFEVQGGGPPPPPPPPGGVVGIPTLSQWGVGLLSVLMAGWAMLTGFGRRRRG
jgi:parallel beta-helix repeat protein